MSYAKLGIMAILENKERRALAAFKKALQDELGTLVSGIFLFGSKARGNNTKASDIDVLVALRTNDKSVNKKVADIAFDIILKYGVDLSVVVMDQSRWTAYQKTPTSFIYNVNKDRIKL